MLVDEFNFNLPESLIAQTPKLDRADKKMMIFDAGKIISSNFNSILDYLQEQDVLVFNDVKVIKAKFSAKVLASGKMIEFNLDRNLLSEELLPLKINQQADRIYWNVIIKGIKKIADGDRIDFGSVNHAIIEKKLGNGFAVLSFDSESFECDVDKHGSTPLPPYIKREQGVTDKDEELYQTVYAKAGSAVAAPTAGLHFTDEIFSKLKNKGVKIAYVTLNVGAGTFLPVRVDEVKNHKMHEEYFEISDANAKIINDTRKSGGRVIAVGTTSLRVIESVADNDGAVRPCKQKTDIFIYPGYKFRSVDGVLTNFHLPKSTLFMLVCAFIGKDQALELYQRAITEEFRFFSYGDCSLLLP